MSDGGSTRQDIPAELLDGEIWLVANRADSGHFNVVSFEHAGDPAYGRTKRHSLADAMSYIQSSEEDLLLVCECPEDVVGITWQCSNQDHHRHDPQIAKALSKLQSFTERVAGGPNLRTIIRAPLDSGRLETEAVSILAGGPRIPIWTPRTANGHIEYLPQSIRMLTEHEFFDIMKPFLPWSQPVADPAPPHPDSWKVSAIRESDDWASVDSRHDLDDIDILERALNAGQAGEYFERLMENRTDKLKMSDQMAKQALMNLLAYWFCFDIGKMKHYFGKSKLVANPTVYDNGTLPSERYVARALQYVDDCYRHEYRKDEVTPYTDTWHPRSMPVKFPGGR